MEIFRFAIILIIFIGTNSLNIKEGNKEIKKKLYTKEECDKSKACRYCDFDEVRNIDAC